MNVTTIIELENAEVEQLAGAKMIFAHEQVQEFIIETCVKGFEQVENGMALDTEDAMQRVLDTLKDQGVVPGNIGDFSFEMPSCERIKQKGQQIEKNNPQKVIISYTI